MRIAVWYNLPSGGAKRALYDHVRGLVKLGHYVEVWCPASADRQYLPLADMAPEHVLPCDDSEVKPLLFPSVRTRAVVMRKRMDWLDRHCRQVASEMNTGRFDVVFTNTCRYSGCAPIAKYTKLPTVLYLQEPYRGLYECDDSPPFASIGPPGRTRLAPWYLRLAIRDWLETPIRRKMVRREYESATAYDRILVNSYFSRESVLRAYGVDSRVCYLGVDLSAFHVHLVPPRDYLIGVGSFTANKNIDFVIRAIGKTPPPRLKLVWVGNFGEDQYISYLSRLAEYCGVTFEPRRLIGQAELTALLGGALAAVYAPRLEPFGYMPLEANACGTPVIGVAEGGLRETIRHGVNGLLVDPTVNELAAAITRLGGDREYASGLGSSGRVMVESDWSVEGGVSRLARHLTEISHRPAHTADGIDLAEPDTQLASMIGRGMS